MRLLEILRWFRFASWAVCPLLLAAESGDPFMGRWEGRYRSEDSDTGPFQVHVIPQGGNSYRLWVRMGEHGSRYDREGVRENETLRFRGRFQVVSGTDDAAYELTGEIRGHRLTGAFESPEGSGTIDLARVMRAPLALQKKPAGALALFDGRNLDHWRSPVGGPPDWRLLPDGSMEAVGRDLVSRQTFAGCSLHVEFLLPLMAAARGQERANSGIVLAGSHEVRILDTFGGEPTKTSCGAIFGANAPRLEATLPPLEWQVLDIRLRSRGSAVRFRNIWIEPRDAVGASKPTSRRRRTGARRRRPGRRWP